MAELKDYQKRWYDKIVAGALILSYVLMIVGTIAGNQLMIEFFSTSTSFLAGTLIMICLPRMGSFALPSFLLGFGIYMWFLGDLINFAANQVLHIPRPDLLIDTIYLFPNVFYGIAVAVYFLQKLKGRALYQFLVNVFSFSVIGFVLVRRILIYAKAYQSMGMAELVRVYLYFFMNIFILIMIFHMVYMIAAETGLKGTNTMILGIFVYVLMDLPYNYLSVIGQNQENVWLNLIYMFCMMLMAHGIFHQIRHKHVFRLKEHEYTEKTIRGVRIGVLAGIIISLILFAAGVFQQEDLMYLLTALLGYWVTTASFQNGALNEQLIKQRDILTGLYNRRYSDVVLAECVGAVQDKEEVFCVYCIDLNHFKPINDTYGHDMGDRVLKVFGSRMLKLSGDYISFRTGGDEFMVIRRHIAGENDVQKGAKVLLELFRRPVELDTYIFRLSGSIGGAIYRTHTTDTEDLIRYADTAMYMVKKSKRKDDFRLFDKDLVRTVEEHRELEEKLAAADPKKDFVLYYQPQLDQKTGKVVGAEIFPRLKGNESYSAGDLIPVAEEIGLMSRLGIWIAEESIGRLASWISNSGSELFIKLNLAPLQLLDREFTDRLKDLTRRLSVSPARIRLDISNEVIMGAAGSAKAVLKELHRFGFLLTVNDFGGGDINLSHILDCGFREIDISHSLIARAVSDPEAKLLIRSIITIADTMGISAAAVGIETKEQATLMRGMNIANVQGYYYGMPAPAAEFEAAYVLDKPF